MSSTYNHIPFTASMFYGDSRQHFGYTLAKENSSAIHAMRLFYEFSGLNRLTPNDVGREKVVGLVDGEVSSAFQQNKLQNKIAEEVCRCSSAIVDHLIKTIKAQVVSQPQAIVSSSAASYSQTSFSNFRKSNRTAECLTAQMTAFSPLSMICAVLLPIPLPFCMSHRLFAGANGSFYRKDSAVVLHNDCYQLCSYDVDNQSFAKSTESGSPHRNSVYPDVNEYFEERAKIFKSQVQYTRKKIFHNDSSDEFESQESAGKVGTEMPA
ncbi:unnamed protein product [Enterobius vermicularis]|uniref:Uncharacterized protein n=1 Tax=Enterobius vermicularis TaxID=51028 RepID=A0A0N4V6X1_ENTVE|nr:unnamed protein product [Enterobius vermicularis]